MKKHLFLVALSIVIYSCEKNKNKNTPQGILSPDSLASIQADFYVIEAANSLTLIKSDTLLNAKYEDYYVQVLNKHNSTKSQVDSSIKFYGKNPEELNQIFKHSLELLELRKLKLKN